MVQKQIQSVGDVAHLLEVHEQVVMEWAARNDVPKVGREFALRPRDVRDFERWLEAASSADADVVEDEPDDDEEEPGDADDTEVDDDDDRDEGDDDPDNDDDGDDDPADEDEV